MRYVEMRKTANARGTKKRNPLFLVLLLAAALPVSLFFINPIAVLNNFFKPISVFSQITGVGKLASDDNRTNVLILGLDKRYQGESGLTDTIIAASLDTKKGEASLFSIPRDVWVKGYHSKINALYALGGVNLVQKVVGEVLDLPIHYFVVLDFAGFERAVDAVMGIEVYVDRDFDDFRYPIPGREDDDCGGQDPEFSCRYEYLSFKKGLQKMNGATALKFSRSRQSSGPEGSDFARALRQQKVMVAFKDKVLSLTTLVNPATLSKLYDEYRASVETNIGLWEVEKLYSFSQKIKNESTTSYVINKNSDGEEILYTPADFTPFDGQWVLLPRTSDFSEVQSFVQKTLFGGR